MFFCICDNNILLNLTVLEIKSQIEKNLKENNCKNSNCDLCKFCYCEFNNLIDIDNNCYERDEKNLLIIEIKN